MHKYKDNLKDALELLGIPEEASITEIRKIYKDLLFKWHPDKCKKDKEVCNEKTRQIQEAYKIIQVYCENYPISFTREDMDKNQPKEAAFRFWMDQFGDDPIWG
jgi:preprotein translocase subunit Sec63